jgi:hypothetical protein
MRAQCRIGAINKARCSERSNRWHAATIARRSVRNADHPARCDAFAGMVRVVEPCSDLKNLVEANRCRRVDGRTGASVHRWTFFDAEPRGYLLSSLNALGNAPLFETLELTVGKFEASSDSPEATRRKRK